MAVVNPDVNLAPSYAMIQQALQQRAQIAGQEGALNPLSTINAIATPIAQQQQLASAQQFELDKIKQKSLLDMAEKKASAKPKVLVTKEGVGEFLKAYGIEESEQAEYEDLFADMIGTEVDEDTARDEAHRRISMRETQKTRKQGAANELELKKYRQAQLDQERETRHAETLRKDVLEYSNKLEANPATKKMREQDISTAQVDTLINLAKSGNTIAATASGAKMAKAMGEVGVLTDEDIKRYVKSGALARGTADKLKKMIDGSPTEATLEEILEIGTAMRAAYQEKIQPVYNDYVSRLAINYKMPTSEAATRLRVPYTGNKLVRAKKKDGTPILLELTPDGKPLKEIDF